MIEVTFQARGGGGEGVRLSKILRGVAHKGGSLTDLKIFGGGSVKRGEVNISGDTLEHMMPVI